MPFPDKLCEAWARKGAFSLCKLAAFSPWTPIGTRILFTDLDNVVRRWDRILTAIPPDALIVAGVGPYDFSAGMFGFTVTPKTLKWYDEMPDNCTHASNDEEWLMCRVGYPLRGSRRSPQHGAWVPFYGSENRDMVKLFKHGVNIDSKTLPPNCDAVLFYGNPRPHTVEQPWNPLYVRV